MRKRADFLSFNSRSAKITSDIRPVLYLPFRRLPAATRFMTLPSVRPLVRENTRYMDAVISIIYARPLLINCRVNNDPHTACVHSSRVRFPRRSLSFSLTPRLRRVLKSRYTLLSLARALRARGKARRGEISRADIAISWHADALSTSARGNSARCVSLSELVSFFVFFSFSCCHVIRCLHAIDHCRSTYLSKLRSRQ